MPAVVNYILIYGRASEFDDKDNLVKQRSGLEPEHTTIMTYDRTRPLEMCKDIPCAQIEGDQLVAKWFPPTFEIRPIDVEDGIARLSGKDQALEDSPGIPSERREFLKGRFQYWDEWAKDHPRGIFAMQDVE